MKSVLAACEVFHGFDDATISRIATIARRERAAAGEHVFMLGESADRLYVVLEGQVDLCIPISIRGSMKNVSVETKGPASALGWSAFVKPYCFRMSARVAEDATLAAIARTELSELLAGDLDTKMRITERIAEITAQRLLSVQALWVRELQRSVLAGNHAGADAR